MKWIGIIAAGFLTVGIGAPFAVWQNQTNVEQYIQANAQRTLNEFGQSWAQVQVSGRDIQASGLATSTQQIGAVEDILANASGARSANLTATLAPKLDPFVLTLQQDNKARSMIGGMPNEALLNQATEWFGDGSVDLKLASGAPDARDWADATQFAIRLLQHFDDGSVTVEGLKVSIDGRAKNHDAYHTLDVVFEAGFPDRLIRGNSRIVAPLVSPFRLSAAKIDDSTFVAEGNVVSKEQVDLFAAAGASVDQLNVSSGAPAGFDDALAKLLNTLRKLKNGRIEMSDASINVTGQAADFASFDETFALEDQLSPFKVEIYLARPVIKPFTINFEVVEGQLSVVGYVPNAFDFKELMDQEGGEKSAKVRVANGAPKDFDKAINLLVDALQHLQNGASAEIADRQITVQGKAISPQDFLALQEKFGNNIPDGYDLAIANIELPEVSPYKWSLNKETEGRVRLAGYSPSSKLTNDIISLLSASSIVDETLPALGQPENFENITLASAAASNFMAEGYIELDANGWLLNATTETKVQQNNLLQQFSDKQIQLKSWQAQFTTLPPPEAKPYRFEAKIDEAGALSFDGYVRSEDTQLLLSGLGQSNVSLASGEPEDFDEAINVGISALQRLVTGQFGFDGEQWYLKGVAAHQDAANATRNDLGDFATSQSAWRIEIEALIVPVVPYLWAAEKANADLIALSGYVPDQLLFDELTATGAKTSALKIGVGAPEQFSAKANAALTSLKLLDAGRASLSGGTWTLIGSASSDDAVSKILEILAPFGSAFRLDIYVVLPVEKLTWRAMKNADGKTSYSGFLADEVVWERVDDVLQRVGPQPAAREAFLERSERGLSALGLLNEGVASFDGANWTIEGDAADTAVLTSVERMLSVDVEPNWKISLVDVKIQAEAEEKARLEAEATAKAEADEKARLAAEATAKAEADEKARLAAEATAKAKAEEKARLAAEAAAKAEADEKARLAAEATAKAEAEEKARLEAEAAAKAEAEEKARLEAEAAAKAEAEEKARLAAEAIAAQKNKFSWGATKSDQGVQMTGNVPNAGVRYGLQLASGLTDTPNLVVQDGAPDRFVASAFAGLQALEYLTQGSVSLSEGRWSISGSAKDLVSRERAFAALGLSLDQWQMDVTTPPGWVICAEAIGVLLQQNTIVFQSGSTDLNASSKQVLADIAAQLKQCPDAVVEVEGHTDADGPADANLTLSVLRAERVVDQLLEYGADATKLYVVGYGETLPIASNDTIDGKRQNRRIVIAVRNALE